MQPRFLLAAGLAALLSVSLAAAEVSKREANNGNLVMEDIPEIPESSVSDLNRYQNVRYAAVQEWTKDGRGMFVNTRFGDVGQIHHVGHAGGARTQVTFFTEPTGSLSRQPNGAKMVFTMDAGGSEFSQIFLLDPAGSDDAIMLTDGESRNGAVVWDRTGDAIAYQSTRRNGASNDVWLMNINNPESARMVLESPDGTWWGATDFSSDNRKLLVLNYVGNADSRVHLLDVQSGELRLLAGDPENPSSNMPVAFDQAGTGFFFVSDVRGDFKQLAWQSLEEDAEPVFLTGAIPWHVEDGALSKDRSRGAFVVNENGFSQLYLMDPASKAYRAVDVIPTGLIGGVKFSPDGSRLGLTINTSQTPSDSFVLDLGDDPLEYGDLTRWTFSEVGGLDTSTFVLPELVSFPTFDSGSGGPESIQAWVYRPPGDGPHPVIISIHGGPEAQALSLIHISEPKRPILISRMPSSS